MTDESTFATEDLYLAALLSMREEPIRAETVSTQRSRWIFALRGYTYALVGEFLAGRARVEPASYARAYAKLQREAKIRHGRAL